VIQPGKITEPCEDESKKYAQGNIFNDIFCSKREEKHLTLNIKLAHIKMLGTSELAQNPK
jgi:hypothetical protein